MATSMAEGRWGGWIRVLMQLLREVPIGVCEGAWWTGRERAVEGQAISTASAVGQ